MLGGVTRHMLPHLPALGPPRPCKQALREHNDQAPGYVVYSSAVTHACRGEDMRARANAKIKSKKNSADRYFL